MSESEASDDNRENVKRYLKYAGFILILVVGWYVLKEPLGL